MQVGRGFQSLAKKRTIHSNDFASQLETPPFRGHRQWLVERHLPLAIHHPLAVKLRHARDTRTRGFLGCVEVDDFGSGLLERQDDGICREHRKVGVELLRMNLAFLHVMVGLRWTRAVRKESVAHRLCILCCLRTATRLACTMKPGRARTDVLLLDCS